MVLNEAEKEDAVGKKCEGCQRELTFDDDIILLKYQNNWKNKPDVFYCHLTCSDEVIRKYRGRRFWKS